MPIQTLSIPTPKRWSLTDCETMERIGLLPDRYELLNGEIFEKMPTNPPHILALTLLAIWLETVFGRFYVRTQVPVWLPSVGSRPEPDAAVTREPMTSYRDRLPEPTDLLLAAEVSDTTLDYDLGEKATLYAQAGIKEYWVLDITGRRLITHRRPGSNGYADIREWEETATVAPEARPDAATPVANLLP